MQLNCRKWDRKKITAAAVGVILFIAAVFIYAGRYEKTQESEVHISSVISKSGQEDSGSAVSTSGAIGLADGIDDLKEKDSKELLIDVGGAVKNPGVVTLKSGARVYQALEQAGGATGDADTAPVNLARILEDGEKVYIPSKVEAKEMSDEAAGLSGEISTSAWSGEPHPGKVNINKADAAGLQVLTGVGPSTAEKILSFRSSHGKFHKIEDLKQVSGIGEKTFEKLKDKICV